MTKMKIHLIVQGAGIIATFVAACGKEYFRDGLSKSREYRYNLQDGVTCLNCIRAATPKSGKVWWYGLPW